MKILIIRFSSIGDIVLTSPVVRCLKSQIKDVEIHFLTKKSFSSIIESNPYIDKIFTINADIKPIISQLKDEEYDYVIDLHNNLRTSIVKSKLRVKSYTVNKLNFKKWLLVNFKINIMPKVHIVDRYIDVVKNLGVLNDGEGLDFFLNKEINKENINIPLSHQNGFIGFVIGGKHCTKVFPENKIISLCKSINKPIILLGGKEDVILGDSITKSCGDLVFNACGKFSLHQSAYIVSISDIIITNDTGLMHIASAFRKKIISIWGNTVPEFGMYPYMPKNLEALSYIIENKEIRCRPCSKIGYNKCPKKHFNCMNSIDENSILEIIKSHYKQA